MDNLKIAILELVVMTSMRELVRMKKESGREKNEILRAGLQRHIQNVERSLDVVLDEITTIKTDSLFHKEIKVGGSD